jgi:pyruvate dehydrogenase E1 component
MMERRRALDGPIPQRVVRNRRPLAQPATTVFSEFDSGSGTQSVSTTMAFTRLLRNICRDDSMGHRVVPIVPDEARTFGMDSLFREQMIYAAHGQKYDPVDQGLLLTYTESSKGQILEEGITEAGSMSSWIAAATSYATRGVPMLPFFIFYSMFGFQRVGDLIWQAADSRARGFLLGATAGRTTLAGEGLQHQDGHSLVLASTVPVCNAYDPAFAYELATIIRAGTERMYGSHPEDVFYYITLYNENQLMPVRQDHVSDNEIMRGLYLFAAAQSETAHASILFSGSANLAAREAAEILRNEYNIDVELWSAPSYKTLREDALEVERWNRLHPTDQPRTSVVDDLLGSSSAPVIAVTDFMRIVPEQIARFLPSRDFIPVGTDGFGRSDTRESLRAFFENNAAHVVISVLSSLIGSHDITDQTVSDALAKYNVDTESPHPLRRD